MVRSTGLLSSLDYTWFLWLEDSVDPDSNLIIYQFRIVLFGATSSPFLLNATIREQLSVLETDKYDMKKGSYVDNVYKSD